jgi:hypothetical protein
MELSSQDEMAWARGANLFVESIVSDCCFLLKFLLAPSVGANVGL